MTATYILCANGNVTLPIINHMMFENLERAKAEAVRVAAALVLAGYIRFDIYDVTGETHVHVANLAVHVPPPVVTIR